MLVPGAIGVVRLKPQDRLRTALKGIEKFSHIWLIWVFDHHGSNDWRPSIRPPRLGGAKKVGVLASRSPHRPNPIGMSVVKLTHIDLEAKRGPELHVEGVDLLDGTPILDIKPYIPYSDCFTDATSGWASEPIEKLPVTWSKDALEQLNQFCGPVVEGPVDQRAALGYAKLKRLIEETLSLDPRPASQRRRLPAHATESEGLAFGFALLNFDVRWKIEPDGFLITEIAPLPEARVPIRKRSSAASTAKMSPTEEIVDDSE